MFHRYRPFAGLLVFMGVLALFLAGCEPESGVDKSLEKAALEVCSGTGLSGAGKYLVGPGAHPLLVILQLDNQSIPQSIPIGDYPQGWLPKTLGEMEIVVCVRDASMNVQTCRYNNNRKIERWQQGVELTIRSALTGARLDIFSLGSGAMPPDCPKSISSANPPPPDLKGAPVTNEQIINRVKTWLLK